MKKHYEILNMLQMALLDLEDDKKSAIDVEKLKKYINCAIDMIHPSPYQRIMDKIIEIDDIISIAYFEEKTGIVINTQLHALQINIENQIRERIKNETI